MTRTACLLLCALALAACSREEPGSAPGATAPAADPSGIDARNAVYPTEQTDSGKLALHDGRYDDPKEEVQSTLVATASGDLDGDGKPDLVAVLATNTGGSGTFYDLYALRRHDGKPLAIAGPAFLGDRIDVKNIRVERGAAVLDLVVQGDQDASCCPTVPTTWRFRLVGNLLDETSGQRRVYIKD